MGIGLEEFLSQVNFDSLERIWFDFKNLQQDDYTQALDRLRYLDHKFGIRENAIIESMTAQSFFKEFRLDGWHTSHYLPTNRIVDLIKNGNNKEMQALSVQIAAQITAQNVSAISFDVRLYPFVKHFMEDKIPSQVVYHVWLTPPLSSPDFKKELLEAAVYGDDRVKTILTPYQSLLDL